MTLLSRTQSSLNNEVQRHRAAALAKLNAEMSAVRILFITDIPGQQMIYSGKEAEAQAYLSLATDPLTLDEYPFIAREVGTTTGATAREVAQTFAAMATAWRYLGSTLEQIRIITKDALNAAQSEAEIVAAMDALEASLKPIRNAA